MIDNFAILLSTAMTVYVIVRATRLDRTRPWFERARPDLAASSDPAAASSRPPLSRPPLSRPPLSHPAGLGAPSRVAALQRALKR